MRFSVLALSAGLTLAALASLAVLRPAYAGRFCAQYDDGREECTYPTYRSCMTMLRGAYSGRCFEASSPSAPEEDDFFFLRPQQAEPVVRRTTKGTAKTASKRAPVNCTRYLGHGKWTDCR